MAGNFPFEEVNPTLNDALPGDVPVIEIEGLSLDAQVGSMQPVKRPPLLNIDIPDKQSPEYITYNHVLHPVGEELNTERYDLNDWRGMASRFGMKGNVIDKIGKKSDDPSKEIFVQCSDKSAWLFLKHLYEMKRHDVIDTINKLLQASSNQQAMEKRQTYKSSKFPSQESTPESATWSEGLSSPPGFYSPCDQLTPNSADSGTGSFDPGVPSERGGPRYRSDSNPRTHSDGKTQNANDEQLSEVDFHSDVSKEVWMAIEPNKMSKTKTWKNFEKYLRKHFSDETEQSELLRFICYVLQVGDFEKRDNKYIKDQHFANMVAWFGPFESGANGCLKKMSKLISGSVGYYDTGAHSFFAGYMSKDQADSRVKDCPQDGTFLIRFSSTNAKKGSFVIALKTPYGAEHIEIKQHGERPTGKVDFDGKTYKHLMHLYNDRLQRGGVSEDRRVSCIHTCLNLPLNTMFKKYKEGPVASTISMGRGRGRGTRSAVTP